MRAKNEIDHTENHRRRLSKMRAGSDGRMATDDDDERIERIMERVLVRVLEAYGFKKPPSAGAERTRRYRERKAEASQNVTRKRHKTSQPKGQDVTKASQPSVTPTAETWTAYAAAYRQRYGVDPVRNAAVNGQLAHFVGRLGAEEAPQVAAFYVSLNRGLYLSARHAVPLMVKHAEALRMEWVTGQGMTDTQARLADRTQTNANVWGKLIAEADDEGKQKPH